MIAKVVVCFCLVLIIFNLVVLWIVMRDSDDLIDTKVQNNEPLDKSKIPLLAKPLTSTTWQTVVKKRHWIKDGLLQFAIMIDSFFIICKIAYIFIRKFNIRRRIMRQRMIDLERGDDREQLWEFYSSLQH
uniref:7TM_GPCR_Srx domain-containing protein n=1 Tax=Caenorhabditis tropicalis TaxID=1561998 RepID=A0A1I7TLQ0_9PELO